MGIVLFFSLAALIILVGGVLIFLTARNLYRESKSGQSVAGAASERTKLCRDTEERES